MKTLDLYARWISFRYLASCPETGDSTMSGCSGPKEACELLASAITGQKNNRLERVKRHHYKLVLEDPK